MEGALPMQLIRDLLEDLNDFLFDNFQFIDNPEIAIECNPAYLDWNYLEALQKAKFNRFSLGIQDFNEKVLASVNRESSVIPVKDILSFLRNNITAGKCKSRFHIWFAGPDQRKFFRNNRKGH